MNVFWGVESPHGMTTKYRTALPSEYVQKHLGWKVDIAADLKLPDPNKFDYDLVMLQRNSTPDTIRLMRMLEQMRLPVGYDVDDDIFSLETTSPVFDLYMKRPDIPWYQLQAMRFATGMTVSTEALCHTYSGVNPKITVLPNCVKLSEWNSRKLTPVMWPKDEIVLVWAGSNTHIGSLTLVVNVLETLLKKHRNLHLVMMGATDLPFLLPSEHITWLGWSPYATYQSVLLGANIGLAPLLGNRFNLGKSDLRIKEYACAGLPIVASPTGAYKDSAVEAGGFVCSTPVEWQNALEQLIDSEQERLDRGMRARDWVESWDIDKHGEKWAEVWEDLATGIH